MSRQEPAPRPTAEQLAASFADGTGATRKSLAGGAVGDTSLVTAADGRVMVHKIAPELPAMKVTAKHQADAEELAAMLAREMGLSSPAVARVDHATVLMEHLPGKVGSDVARDVRDRLDGSDEGRVVDLLDQIIDNTDRHGGNWLYDGKRVQLIDHGMAFQYRRGPDHPVPRSGFSTKFSELREWTTPEGKRQYGDRFRDFDISPGDIRTAKRILTRLRAEFEKRGQADWYDKAQARLDAMLPYAKGTKDRLKDTP